MALALRPRQSHPAAGIPGRLTMPPNRQWAQLARDAIRPAPAFSGPGRASRIGRRQTETVSMEVLFASVPVADLRAARTWYRRLFGRDPDIVPHESEVMWCVAGNGWLYVIEDPERAGLTVVTVSVDDLDRFVAELATRGIASGPIEPVGDAGRKSNSTDPDGNVISWVQATAADQGGRAMTPEGGSSHPDASAGRPDTASRGCASSVVEIEFPQDSVGPRRRPPSERLLLTMWRPGTSKHGFA